MCPSSNASDVETLHNSEMQPESVGTMGAMGNSYNGRAGGARFTRNDPTGAGRLGATLIQVRAIVVRPRGLTRMLGYPYILYG